MPPYGMARIDTLRADDIRPYGEILRLAESVTACEHVGAALQIVLFPLTEHNLHIAQKYFQKFLQ